MKKVYLAGQFSEYDGWKNSFENIEGLSFITPRLIQISRLLMLTFHKICRLFQTQIF